MSNPKYGLVAIGNAMVDVLAQSTDEFIDEQSEKHGMQRNSMNLIDESRAVELYSEMGPGIEASGGSAGNTMACYASFGGKGAYIGKVADDQLGEVFRHDMKSLGVHYETTPLAIGAPTGRCMVLITPDGHRTMNTFLGAAVELGPDDVEESLIADCAVTYLEGYLFDPPLAMEAFKKAAKIAHDAGRKVSLTLSDPFCVDRHREAFRDLVDNHVDILFANEEEIKSLYEVFEWDQVLPVVQHKCEVMCLTRSELGSTIIHGDDVYDIPAEKVEKVIDTTGAGDAYAAGFLYGYTNGMDINTSGQLAAIAAAEIISHIGPRPEVQLASLIPKKAA